MDLLAGVELAVHLAFLSVPQMSTADLAQLQQVQPASVLVVDVRTTAEFAVSHIPGARHLNPELDAATQTADLQSWVTPDIRTVVLYCSVGWRSAELVKRLAPDWQHQKPQVQWVNLRGSIFRWAREDRPLQNAQGSTRLVHGFNSNWARLMPPDRVTLAR